MKKTNDFLKEAILEPLLSSKLLLIMKLTTFLIMICFIQVSAEAFSQKINLNHSNIEINTVLNSIEKQTNFHFIYDDLELQGMGKISLKLNNVSLENALAAIFKDQPFDYKILENTIVLRKLPETKKPGKLSKQLLLVEGEVRDENGDPLAGVSVRIKDKSVATMTDADGRFKINVLSSDETLVFSFLGFKNLEKSITTGMMRVQLVIDPSNLDEVVVIGYGTTSQKLNTGSVSSVTSKILGQQPVANPLSALQGRIPGLTITSNSGMPGSSFNVRIRGEGSLQAGSEPLYVIDGVPFSSSPLNQFSIANGNQSPLNSINPNDIERIDVLKDADATSIYGSRGANGVILITTKKGHSGKNKIDFNINTGISSATKTLNMLSIDQYLELRKEAFKNDNIVPNETNAPDLLIWDQKQDTDWYNELMGKNAPATQAQLSFSGGNDQTKFLISGGYLKHENVTPGSLDYTRGSILLSLNNQSVDGRFKIGASLNYSKDQNNLMATDITQYYNLSPNLPIYGDDSKYYWYSTLQNPMALAHRSSNSTFSSLLGNATLEYEVINNLNVKTSIGYTQTGMNQIQTSPFESFNPQNYTGSAGQYGFSFFNTYIIEPQLTYKFNKNNNTFNFLVGGTFQKNFSEGHNLYGTGYTSDSQLQNMRNAASLVVRGYNYADYRYASLFGRVNYNYSNKYLANLTFRRDGSTRFGPNKHYGNFGSLGLAWIFTSEDFFSDNLVLTFGKLRGSYGSSGNDQIGDYQYLDTWNSSLAVQGLTGLNPARVFNPNFGWEDNRKIDAGLELGFFNERIFLNAGYYNNRSSTQLVQIALSPQAGFSSFLGNFPAKIENSGLELDLSTSNILTKDFNWKTNFNFSVAKNKLIEYKDIEKSADSKKYVIGESIRIVKGYDFLGVDKETGLGQYTDLNDDGKLTDPEDFVILGDLLPSFFGGISNEFNYKSLSLSFFFQFVKQEGPMSNYGPMATPYGALGNTDTRALDRWQKPGDITNVPRATTTSGDPAYANFRDNYRFSSAVWGDASFIRMKNLAVSYSIPQLNKKFGLDNVNVYFQAQNLFTLTKYKGMDPEMQGFNRDNVSNVMPFGAVKAATMPIMKVVTFGLRVTL